MGTQIFDSQIKDNIALTGTPTAPTPSVDDDSTRIATTEFVHNVFGEFYPTGVTPTYVDANNFTVSGDLTAIFTQGRVLKITDTGGTFNAVCVSSAYDSGTELTTVTVAGDTIDSGISVVLYAVQQVTGQIWESGSNANGKYVKFADGTMIASTVLSLTATNNNSTGTTGTLPATFISGPALNSTSSVTSGGGAACRVLEGGTTQTTYTGKILTVANGGSVTGDGTSYAMFLFVGRWF